MKLHYTTHSRAAIYERHAEDERRLNAIAREQYEKEQKRLRETQPAERYTAAELAADIPPVPGAPPPSVERALEERRRWWAGLNEHEKEQARREHQRRLYQR